MVGVREEAAEDIAVVDTTVMEDDHTVVGHMEAEGTVEVASPTEEEVMGAAIEITMEEEDMEVEAAVALVVGVVLDLGMAAAVEHLRVLVMEEGEVGVTLEEV